MTNFETLPKKLKEDLLNSIHTCDTALPDFQRDFVWLPSQTKGLIVSLAKRFPAGSLLRLETSDQNFQARPFVGAPELNSHIPKYLVLDGQQRLSSLYHALYGTGEHVYYVSFKTLLELADDDNDIEDAFEFYRRSEGDYYYGNLEKQAKWGVLPLEVIFGGDGFHRWLRNIEKTIKQLETEGKPTGFTTQDIDRVEARYEQYVETIAKYEFPVVTLPGTTSLEAVCSIFETLNSTGVRLSVFDLLSARFYAQNDNLRQRWADALQNTRYLAAFDIDPYYVLQTICTEAQNSIKRSDVLKLKPDTVNTWWDDAIWGMDEALDMLYNECGVLKAELLSYNTILVPLAAAFMTHRNLVGPAKGAFRLGLQRWYWCSVFGQRYESNPTSQTITDHRELKRWFEGGELPESIRDFQFQADRLKSTTIRQRAVYRGVLCLILRQGPKDFHSTQQLTAGVMQQSQVDDHHIFPDAYLKSTTELPQQEIDAIVNRTLIDRETNQRIGKNPPSKYLNYIAAEWNHPARLDDVLASHLLPTGNESSLRSDDFETFRKDRAAQLYQHIVAVTS